MATGWSDVFILPDGGQAASAGAPAANEPGRGRFFSRLRDNLSRSRQALTAEVSASFFDRLDAEAFERLEEALILSDVGAPVTADVVGRLESEVSSGATPTVPSSSS